MTKKYKYTTAIKKENPMRLYVLPVGAGPVAFKEMQATIQNSNLIPIPYCPNPSLHSDAPLHLAIAFSLGAAAVIVCALVVAYVLNMRLGW